MLREEEIWDVLLVDEEKGSYCSETNPILKPADPRTNAIDFISSLPWSPKKSLFENTFVPFAYPM